MNNSVSQLKGMDLVRWLDNKLGNPSDLWCGRQASSVLSREILHELSSCFQALEPHVKLKIIEAIPHLSPKLVQMWREPLNNLLQITKEDADNWIRTVAKMYIDYPNTSAIKCDISDMDKQFADTVNDFQKILDLSIPNLECNVIPLDSLIVTPAATQMAFGYSTSETKKHFSLRKPLKAEQMLQDALRLAQTTHSPVKRCGQGVISTLPIRVRSTIRKPDNTLPMRGIPSVPVSKISSGFSNEPKKFQRNVLKRTGGAVLIDISDLPQAPSLKKRRGTTTPRATKSEPDPSKEPKRAGRKSKQQKPNEQPAEQSNPLNENTEVEASQRQPEMPTNADEAAKLVVSEPFASSMMGKPKLDQMMSGAFSFI